MSWLDQNHIISLWQSQRWDPHPRLLDPHSCCTADSCGSDSLVATHFFPQLRVGHIMLFLRRSYPPPQQRADQVNSQRFTLLHTEVDLTSGAIAERINVNTIEEMMILLPPFCLMALGMSWLVWLQEIIHFSSSKVWISAIAHITVQP